VSSGQGRAERRQPFLIQVKGLHHPVFRTVRAALVPVTTGEPIGVQIDTDELHKILLRKN
jgi:hypothetical protein